jgi:hypothetical protein
VELLDALGLIVRELAVPALGENQYDAQQKADETCHHQGRKIDGCHVCLPGLAIGDRMQGFLRNLELHAGRKSIAQVLLSYS